jgi:hypothetical protein
MRALKALFKCCAPKEERKEDSEEEKIAKGKKQHRDPVGEMSFSMDPRISIDKEFTRAEESKSVLDSDVNLEKEILAHEEIKIAQDINLDYLKILFEDRLIRDDEKEYIIFVK